MTSRMTNYFREVTEDSNDFRKVKVHFNYFRDSSNDFMEVNDNSKVTCPPPAFCCNANPNLTEDNVHEASGDVRFSNSPVLTQLGKCLQEQ